MIGPIKIDYIFEVILRSYSRTLTVSLNFAIATKLPSTDFLQLFVLLSLSSPPVFSPPVHSDVPSILSILLFSHTQFENKNFFNVVLKCFATLSASTCEGKKEVERTTDRFSFIPSKVERLVALCIIYSFCHL